MAGGNWEIQNKVRPGAYINFETNGLTTTLSDATGAVVIPLSLDWGEIGTFIKVTPTSKFKELFGKSISELKPIREAFKGTNQVIVYNLAGASGVKATVTTGQFVITAKHKGADGNKINITTSIGLDDAATIKTFFDGVEVDSQKVKTMAELESNAYVDFSGSLPTTNATVTLTGGKTTAATNESHANCAAALDTQDFKVVAVSTSDETVKALYALKVKEWRSEIGKNVTLVINDYNAADHEGVVSVLNGVTLEGNEVLSASEALYWYAAAYANAITNSLTYTVYPGAVDCERKTHSEIVQALLNGHIIFTFYKDSVVVEQDINTFHSFTPEKNQDFRKNKIVRSMDFTSNNVQYVYSKSFIGKVNNHPDGRNLFKQQIMKEVLDELRRRGAIEPYVPEDINILPGDEKDAMFVEMGIKYTDAMEKMYMKVACK